MSVQLNHTIVWCRDKHRSSSFLVELLGLPRPAPFGPMLIVQLDNGVSLDYYDEDGEIASQHYAFLIGEDDFDPIFARIQAQGLPYWADPGKRRANAINRLDGGRRVYFDDPDGHLLEIFTQPQAVT
ncbi:VOC family protein [Pseudomonas fluorescens]|uniref:Glutathione transferase FosA n=1 Tax=Pseudomonas fluorescens TaxID=294 RepID=A0A5E7CC53_PSEFL|nr:VOC family protein [Pseudomonas fluorescens]VVO02393.1 Glutathione transferase FosA [Pseudomonas fluorescens]